MRETKFRYYWQHDETGYMLSRIFTLDEIESGEITKHINILGNRYGGPVAHSEYIGVRDMLLREIFEHDIVENEHGTIGVVEYITEHYGCSFTIRQTTKTKDWKQDFYDPMGMRSLFHEIKVIGNTYEDPELKEKANRCAKTK